MDGWSSPALIRSISNNCRRSHSAWGSIITTNLFLPRMDPYDPAYISEQMDHVKWSDHLIFLGEHRSFEGGVTAHTSFLGNA